MLLKHTNPLFKNQKLTLPLLGKVHFDANQTIEVLDEQVAKRITEMNLGIVYADESLNPKKEKVNAADTSGKNRKAEEAAANQKAMQEKLAAEKAETDKIAAEKLAQQKKAEEEELENLKNHIKKLTFEDAKKMAGESYSNEIEIWGNYKVTKLREFLISKL